MGLEENIESDSALSVTFIMSMITKLNMATMSHKGRERHIQVKISQGSQLPQWSHLSRACYNYHNVTHIMFLTIA